MSKYPTKETDIQSDYVEGLALQHSKVSEVTASFPNGGKRTISYAMRLKREGMKKGFPDMGVFWPAGKYHGLFLEFKSKKGRLKEEQVYALNKLSERGYYC